MSARLKEEYYKSIRAKIKKDFQFKSVMQVSRLEKIVLNVGIGEAHSNQTLLNSTIDELTLIAGQKAVKTVAKKPISNFKIREGYEVGCRVTMRGDMMYEFLDRLINITLPRVRDFRGLSPKSFDNFGNYNFTVMEQIVFPEINFDKVDRIHGINVTIVTTGNKKEEVKALLDEFGMPFRQ